MIVSQSAVSHLTSKSIAENTASAKHIRWFWVKAVISQKGGYNVLALTEKCYGGFV